MDLIKDKLYFHPNGISSLLLKYVRETIDNYYFQILWVEKISDKGVIGKIQSYSKFSFNVRSIDGFSKYERERLIGMIFNK